MEHLKNRTWAEIDLGRLEHNYRALRATLAPDCRFLAVVKANAYGHGMIPVAHRLEKLGADYLAVACMDEGIALRQAGVSTPILILGHTSAQYVQDLLEHRLTPCVDDGETARSLSAAVGQGRSLRVHLKVDTGMSRLGLPCTTENLAGTVEEIASLQALPGLEWEGIFTHFADADESEEYTMLQLTRFLELLAALEKKGITFPIRHCAASAAVLQYPCTHLDMVRPGLILYGYYPDETFQGMDGPGLLPMMTLKTRVAAIREIPAGTPVSYGCIHTMERDSRLAVLPIGYADGLPRNCSDKLQVLIGGARAQVVGRICMDMCMVDVTDLPQVKRDDEVVVYGDGLPVEESAGLAGTIQYELLCAVSGRVPRVYLE